MSDVRFRLIGINQDNRADGTGKAGLTFQAIGYYNISGAINTVNSNAGGWRDSMLRKNLNDESAGTIWNAIQSTDFKNNITPVLKTTNNDNSYSLSLYNKYNSNASFTVDKLFILSPSEMGMPIIKNYKNISGYVSQGDANGDANVHYYDSDSYKNTTKSSADGNTTWSAGFNYIYNGNAYKWWMLPVGFSKMSNGSQAYHNTDSYSYCALSTISNPSNYNIYLCEYYNSLYWLRSADYYDFAVYRSMRFHGNLEYGNNNDAYGVVVSFSF